MTYKCPKCGTAIEEGVNLCPICGQQFNWPTKTFEPVVASEPSQAFASDVPLINEMQSASTITTKPFVLDSDAKKAGIFFSIVLIFTIIFVSTIARIGVFLWMLPVIGLIVTSFIGKKGIVPIVTSSITAVTFLVCELIDLFSIGTDPLYSSYIFIKMLLLISATVFWDVAVILNSLKSQENRDKDKINTFLKVTSFIIPAVLYDPLGEALAEISSDYFYFDFEFCFYFCFYIALVLAGYILLFFGFKHYNDWIIYSDIYESPKPQYSQANMAYLAQPNYQQTGYQAQATYQPQATVAKPSAQFANVPGYRDLTTHILLTIFILVIYIYIWSYKVTEYLNRVTDEPSRDPTSKLLLCIFVPFYIVYWFYDSARRIDKLYASIGQPSDTTTEYLLLALFLMPVAAIMMQDRINKFIVIENGGVGTVTPGNFGTPIMKTPKEAWRCYSCGSDNPATSDFCSICGSKRPEKQVATSTICSNCGNMVEPNSAFCPKCGKAVNQELPVL